MPSLGQTRGMARPTEPAANRRDVFSRRYTNPVMPDSECRCSWSWPVMRRIQEKRLTEDKIILRMPEWRLRTAGLRRTCGRLKLQFVNGVRHGRGVKDVVHRIPCVTAEPVWREDEPIFLWL